MTELIQRKLSDSAVARWSVLGLVAFTMMCGYFITDMMAPLQDLLQHSVETGGLGWSANDYGTFTSAYGWFNVFFLMLIFGGMILDKMGVRFTGLMASALMIVGVAGLFIVGRLPLWIIVFVVARDLLLLVGGAYLLKRWKKRVAVIYPGKVATTLLFVGFATLLLNWPVLTGFGVVDVSWLPGLNSDPYSWGIWFVYAGMILALFTTIYYVVAALREIRAAKSEQGVD